MREIVWHLTTHRRRNGPTLRRKASRIVNATRPEVNELRQHQRRRHVFFFLLLFNRHDHQSKRRIQGRWPVNGQEALLVEETTHDCVGVAAEIVQTSIMCRDDTTGRRSGWLLEADATRSKNFHHLCRN